MNQVNTFDKQDFINILNTVKNANGCDVETYSYCELPSQIKELFKSLGVKHTIIPDKYYSKDVEDVLYIMPKRKIKIECSGGFFNEN